MNDIDYNNLITNISSQRETNENMHTIVICFWGVL